MCVIYLLVNEEKMWLDSRRLRDVINTWKLLRNFLQQLNNILQVALKHEKLRDSIIIIRKVFNNHKVNFMGNYQIIIFPKGKEQSGLIWNRYCGIKQFSGIWTWKKYLAFEHLISNVICCETRWKFGENSEETSTCSFLLEHLINTKAKTFFHILSFGFPLIRY